MIVIPKNNIKVYRAYKNVSQKEVAEAIGITQQTLSRIETTNNTNLNTAKKIADYFGVGIDDIFLDKNTINNSDYVKVKRKIQL